MSFIKNKDRDLVYYTIESFEKTDLVKHGFSTRLGGVSSGDLKSLNLGVKKKDTREKAIIAKIRNCARIAALVENKAKRLNRIMVTIPTNFIFSEGNIATILSEKPMT